MRKRGEIKGCSAIRTAADELNIAPPFLIVRAAGKSLDWSVEVQNETQVADSKEIICYCL